MPGLSDLDEFSEKLQTAFDPPFWKFSENSSKSDNLGIPYDHLDHGVGDEYYENRDFCLSTSEFPNWDFSFTTWPSPAGRIANGD